VTSIVAGEIGDGLFLINEVLQRRLPDSSAPWVIVSTSSTSLDSAGPKRPE
jgi:hypothetical protein